MAHDDAFGGKITQQGIEEMAARINAGLTPRDPERIDRIIGKLRRVWHTVPDWRLGQLVLNQARPGSDPFYMEDDWLEDCLDICLDGEQR